MKLEKRDGRAHLHRVARDLAHVELGAEELTVDREGVSSEGSRAEREGRDAADGRAVRSVKTPLCEVDRYAREEVAHAVEVAGERVGVSQEEVREADGLSALVGCRGISNRLPLRRKQGRENSPGDE